MSYSQHPFHNNPNQLPLPFRLFRGDEEDDPEPEQDSKSSPNIKRPSPGWTVREFFGNYVMPSYMVPKKRAPETIRLYWQVIRLWERYTHNPPIWAIEQSLCEQFVGCLKQRKGLDAEFLADNTVRKLCVHFQKILDLAGPRNLRRNRTAARILDEVPYLERPDKVEEAAEDDFSLVEIGLWLGVCDRAASAKNLLGLNPEVYWTSLILFCYNTGLRIDCVMQATWEMVDKKKKDWIAIPRGIYKGKKRGGDFYLNPAARAAIAAVHMRRDEHLFPWRNWPGSQSWLQEQRRRQLAATAIPEDRHFGFHGLRRALLNWLYPRNWGIAKLVAGHKTRDVMLNHYANPEQVRSLMDQVPQPVAVKPKLKQ